MKRDVITATFQEHLEHAGGDMSRARTGFYNQFDDLIENHDVTLENVSLNSIFEAVTGDMPVDRASGTSIAEAMTAASMPNLIGKLLHPVFIKAYQPKVEGAMSLVTQVDSKRKEENVGGLTAHNELEMVNELQPYEESQPEEKRALIVNKKFGRMISLSAEAVLFDQTGEVLIRARQVGQKAGTHLHAFIVQKTADLAVAATGTAAGTAFTLNGTARAIYADTHASYDNFANDNLAASTSLGHDGLVTVTNLLAAMVDEKGTPVMATPLILLLPDALRVLGLQLMGSVQQFGQTGDTTVAQIQTALNVFKGAYTVVTSPFLDADSATTWYLGDPAQQMRLQWVWRPRTESLGNTTQIAFTNDVIAQFKVSYFAGVGATDYRFMVRATA